MAKSKKKEKKSKSKPFFEIGSGNVFIDIGFPEDEAVNLLARARLMNQIEDIIQSNNWTQAKAAKVLGVNQPRVSDLLRGRIENFTVDMLMKWLYKLGKEVTISIKNKATA